MVGSARATRAARAEIARAIAGAARSVARQSTQAASAQARRRSALTHWAENAGDELASAVLESMAKATTATDSVETEGLRREIWAAIAARRRIGELMGDDGETAGTASAQALVKRIAPGAAVIASERAARHEPTTWIAVAGVTLLWAATAWAIGANIPQSYLDDAAGTLAAMCATMLSPPLGQRLAREHWARKVARTARAQWRRAR